MDTHAACVAQNKEFIWFLVGLVFHYVETVYVCERIRQVEHRMRNFIKNYVSVVQRPHFAHLE